MTARMTPLVITPMNPCNLCNLVQPFNQRLHATTYFYVVSSDSPCNLCNLFLGLNDARAHTRMRTRAHMRADSPKGCKGCTAPHW